MIIFKGRSTKGPKSTLRCHHCTPRKGLEGWCRVWNKSCQFNQPRGRVPPNNGLLWQTTWKHSPHRHCARWLHIYSPTTILWRKLSWIAPFCHVNACHIPPKFCGETFANSHKTAKFAKVFSLKSFPPYGITIWTSTWNVPTEFRDSTRYWESQVLLAVVINLTFTLGCVVLRTCLSIDHCLVNFFPCVQFLRLVSTSKNYFNSKIFWIYSIYIVACGAACESCDVSQTW